MFPSLELRTRQSMTLTPRVQQALRLLQLSTVDFEQEMREALDFNPFLEEATEVPQAAATINDAALVTPQEAAASDPAPETGAEIDTAGIAEVYLGSAASDAEETDWADRSHMPTDLREHLRDQLRLSQMGERDRALASIIIDALDDDGYLIDDLDSLAALVLEANDVSGDDLLPALRFVQTLDPTGVGARNLQECLMLQLRSLPESTPGLQTALALIGSHIELLARRDFGRLQHLLSCADSDIHRARTLIRSLDPHPGRRFAPDQTRYVVPDVLVAKSRGRWVVSVNPEVMPRIRINRAYADLALGLGRNNAMSHQLQEARWLLRNMKQRFVTIHRVAKCIVGRQQNFFEHGEMGMKPMILKEVADEIGLHPSTVCRVTNGKYMATPRGLFEFKQLFSRQLATDHGETCSATAIRALIRELIAEENPSTPLSDAQIARVLGGQGLHVARRTVTKYRTLMKLPSVELRRAMAELPSSAAA